MKLVLDRNGNQAAGTPDSVINTGSIAAILGIDPSGNVKQITKELLQQYLNGDITFEDLVVSATLQVGGTSLFSSAVTFATPNIYSITTGIAAGTTQTQAGATQLTTEWNNVTTVTTANDGVKLPTAVAGLSITIKNTGANTALVYPFLGDFIDDELVNAAISIAPEQEITFKCISSTVWESNIEVVSSTKIISGPGTEALPGITFSGDPDTGFYRIGANNIGVSANGAKVLDIGTTGLGVTGGVTTTNWVFDNGSGAVVPATDNARDIGNLLSNPRDIHASRAFIKKGIATAGYGQLALKSITATVTFAGGATEVIPVQVPSGAKIVSCQLRNDSVLVGAGATTYSAAYSGGSTQAISTGTAFALNTKVNTFFDVNAATDIASALTDVTLTPDAGTLDTGSVTAVVYYYEMTSLTDAG